MDEFISTVSLPQKEESQREERCPRPPGIFLNKNLSVTMSDGSCEMTIQLSPQDAIEWALNLAWLAKEVSDRTAAPRNPMLEN